MGHERSRGGKGMIGSAGGQNEQSVIGMLRCHHQGLLPSFHGEVGGGLFRRRQPTGAHAEPLFHPTGGKAQSALDFITRFNTRRRGMPPTHDSWHSVSPFGTFQLI